jgi:hypothetical protein
MNNIKELMPKLLDTSSRKIQCSNEKTVPSVFKSYDEALEYNFVRFGNKYFIPAISIDIDDHQSFKKVSSVLKENKLPTPNIIVKTSKGLHIHWILLNPIKTSSMAQLSLYQNIADELVKLFGSDSHAMPKNSGRMFRNPLKHQTTFLTVNEADLSDFAHIIPKKEKVTADNKVRSRALRYKIPDFTTITEGGRNQALFDYGRYTAYRYGNRDGLQNAVEAAIKYANDLLPEPLSTTETLQIATSITRFITTRYNKRTANNRTIEFNRKLANKQAEIKKNELLKKWAGIGILTIKKLASVSNREGGRILKVHKNTFAKHKEFLIATIKKIHILFEKPLSFKVPENTFDNTITIPFIGYQPVKVLHCTSPPTAE